MNDLNNKVIENLIVQSEQLIDIKNDTMKRITSLNDLLEQEKSNLEDYNTRETSLFEETVFEAKDLNLLNDNDVENLDIEELIQFIQIKLSSNIKINTNENNRSEHENLSIQSNVVNIEDHKRPNDIINSKIDSYEWNLSIRAQNCLKNNNIITISDLIAYGEEGLMRVPNFGRKNLREIQNLFYEKFGIYLPFESSIKEIYNKDDEEKGIKKVIFEVLDSTMTDWESAIMKYKYGLFDDAYQNDKWIEYNASDYGLNPGQSWNYMSCYNAQHMEIPEVHQMDIPIWSYTTTIKYINKALRKLKHPTRARRFTAFLLQAEKIAKSMGKELYNYENNHRDENNTNIIYLSEIPECNNHYYAFICSIFGQAFRP